jgi:hypothetical protein
MWATGKADWTDSLQATLTLSSTTTARKTIPRKAGASEEFFVGQTWCPDGDSIQITSVRWNDGQMVVKGHYQLVSRERASLQVNITVSSTNHMITRQGPRQAMRITKGAGDFELVHPNVVPGMPHVTMYADGSGFADVYFGTREEADEERKLSLGSTALKPIPSEAVTLFNEMKVLPDSAPYKDKTQNPAVRKALESELAARIKKITSLLKGTEAEPLVNQQEDVIRQLRAAVAASDNAKRDAAGAEVKAIGLQIEKLLQESTNKIAPAAKAN